MIIHPGGIDDEILVPVVVQIPSCRNAAAKIIIARCPVKCQVWS